MSSKNIKEAMYLELREDRAVNNIRERRQVEWPAVAAIDTVMVWLLLYLRGKKDHSSCCVETRLGERMAKESHWVFLKTQMRKDGNLIVMGNGEKQFVPQYISNSEPTGSAYRIYMGCEKRREHQHF